MKIREACGICGGTHGGELKQPAKAKSRAVCSVCGGKGKWLYGKGSAAKAFCVSCHEAYLSALAASNRLGLPPAADGCRRCEVLAAAVDQLEERATHWAGACLMVTSPSSDGPGRFVRSPQAELAEKVVWLEQRCALLVEEVWDLRAQLRCVDECAEAEGTIGKGE